MDQTYIEVLVARERNMAAAMLKVICGILAGGSLLAMPFSAFMLLAAAVFAGLAYVCYLQEWVEYEYSYMSRELTVDKILAKSRRKSVATYLLDQVEAGAPEGSVHLDRWKQQKGYTVKDYSGRDGKNFVLYYEGSCKLLLEADEALIQALHSAAPGKIHVS